MFNNVLNKVILLKCLTFYWCWLHKRFALQHPLLAKQWQEQHQLQCWGLGLYWKYWEVQELAGGTVWCCVFLHHQKIQKPSHNKAQGPMEITRIKQFYCVALFVLTLSKFGWVFQRLNGWFQTGRAGCYRDDVFNTNISSGNGWCFDDLLRFWQFLLKRFNLCGIELFVFWGV